MSEMVPKIRFQGFIDDWEQRKLDTIFKKIRNAFVGTATPYYVDKGHFYLESNNVKNGQINRDTEIFINDEFYNKQSDKLLHTGDIVMVQSGHVGHSAVIPPELDGIVAHALIMLTNYKEETNPFFLNYQFQTYKSKRRLDTITTGNTIKHILSSEMKEFIVGYPSFEEQQKIGTFLQQLDNLITLHQRKLDLLKEQKKGFLQKMFPKDGQLVPEVRFAGFADDWEQRELKKSTKLITKGTTPRDKSGKGTINFVKVENIANGRIHPGSYINVEEHNGYLKRSKLEENDLLFSIAGTLGRTALVDKSILPANTNQALAIIRGYDFDPYFLITSLSGRVVKDYIRKNPTVGAQPNLSLEQIGNLILHTPVIDEQEKIGLFFKQLDNLITLHQRKLDSLKEQKKGFLQKMFVS